jgi:two-component system, NtrC family, sensor kinase
MDNNFTHSLPLPAFDRELDFEELLSGINRERMIEAVRQSLDVPVRLLSADGMLSLGDALSDVHERRPIRSNMESVAYMEVASDTGKRSAGIATLLEILLQSTARYLMASDLHLEAVHTDYEELAKKHAELMKSEKKYRELSAQLEQRVAAQLTTIESAQRQLYQTEKMASVGQLAAGVAHEINNPMGFINSNLATAKDYVDTLSDFAERLRDSLAGEKIESAWKRADLDFLFDDFRMLLKESIDGASRVTSIVRDLKDFSNIDRGDEQIVDPGSILKSTCNVARYEFGDGIDLDLELNPLPATRCHPGHFGQACMNILRNAAQAMNGTGTISIRAHSDHERVTMHITDTGVGMPADVIKRAFEPFFSRRGVGQGTGLGLTVARDILQAHGGGISIESRENEGTTVHFWLPTGDAKNRDASQQGNGRNIMNEPGELS